MSPDRSGVGHQELTHREVAWPPQTWEQDPAENPPGRALGLTEAYVIMSRP